MTKIRKAFERHKTALAAWALAPAFLGLMACGQRDHDSTVSWGHLKELDKGITPAPFLFGLGASDRLNVCFGPLARGVSADWLRAEVFSAVNVWAMSIGRVLAIDFNDCPRPPSLRIVFAAPPVNEAFIGYTHFIDGERRVYLNPTYDWEDIGTTLGFGKQPEFATNQWPKKATFLLPIVAQGFYSPMKLGGHGVSGKIKQATFGTLVHELGHAWGLCDLYQAGSSDPGFHENCSSTQRSERLGTDEVMGAGTTPGTARFGLSAEDRAGLQRLAARPGFPTKGWENPGRPLSADAALAKALRP